MAEVAAWLAWRASLEGHPVDRRLVESAALLHDLDKLPRIKAEVEGLRHAEGSARWLAEHGFGELAPIVESHPVTRLADDEWYSTWLSSATPEALIVSYADKRAGQRLEPMRSRFDSWSRRYPTVERKTRARGAWTPATVERVRERSAEVERRVCAMAGVRPEDVRRLRWTTAARTEPDR